jgi:polysaccharide biosynthesis protein PslG
MRRLSRLIGPAIGAGLIATAVPVGAAAAAPVVPDQLFGQHVSRISAGVTTGLPSVGAIRLWDAGVSWMHLEPADNQYNWAPMEAAINNAVALGASEILYTMGNTPSWAASDPNSSKALYGPGTNSHPRSNTLYTDFVRDLLTKFPQITAFQIWNEANLVDFYNGTPAQMAQLTKDAAVTVKSVRPGVKVVAASTTVRTGGPTQKFGKAYGAAMKRAGAWKYVDVVSAHFYPPATKGPAERVKYVKKMKSWYKKYGAGRKPMWDTEMNYGDMRSYMKVKRAYTGTTAETYVARTYIDSMRYGVQRVFWYLWDATVLGTDMTQNGQLTAGGQAFLEIRSWMSGKTWRGCKVKSSVTTCRVGSESIVYGSKKRKTIKVPRGVTVVEFLDGTQQAVTPGAKFVVTTQPVLFRA